MCSESKAGARHHCDWNSESYTDGRHCRFGIGFRSISVREEGKGGGKCWEWGGLPVLHRSPMQGKLARELVATQGLGSDSSAVMVGRIIVSFGFGNCLVTVCRLCNGSP